MKNANKAACTLSVSHKLCNERMDKIVRAVGSWRQDVVE